MHGTAHPLLGEIVMRCGPRRFFRKATRRASVAYLLAATMLAAPAYAQYEGLVSRISPAVVFLRVSKPGLGTVEGSGFFVQPFDGSVPRGGVITACHVVAGADSVTAYTQAGQTLLATPLSS